MKKLKPKIVKIKLNYRDEKCSACHKKFRAGKSCEGYMHLILVGYHDVGLSREKLLICNDCKDIIYKLLDCPTMNILTSMPQAYYSLNTLGQSNPRPAGMSINNKHVKYNRAILEKEVAKYEKKMKRKEPWSNVNYRKVSGLK